MNKLKNQSVERSLMLTKRCRLVQKREMNENYEIYILH